MRVLKFLFTSFLILAVMGAIGGLVAREGLLIWGSGMIRTSLSVLQEISKRPTDYVSQCRQKGSPFSNHIVDKLQLRFISSTEYVTEVICDQFPLDPIVIDDKKLPPLVQKVPGSGGIIWGKDPSTVSIQLYGRRKDITVSDDAVSTTLPPARTQPLSPVTSCAGFGYTCCQMETQQGVGDPYNQVTDCQRTCYARCTLRPVVLSFNSDPFADGPGHSVQIKSGESITFSFVVSEGDQKNLQSHIDYGDGGSEDAKGLSGQFPHVYSCGSNQSQCTYIVQIHAKDVNNSQSVDTPITRVIVNVNP